MNNHLPSGESAQPVSAYTDVSPEPSRDDELTDADLDNLVGGLARTWNGLSPDVFLANPSYTIARLDPHDVARRISA